MLADVIKRSHSELLESEEAQAYLHGRGISAEQWDKHQLGYIGTAHEFDPTLDPGHGISCQDRDKKQYWCDSCRYRAWSTLWETTDENLPKIPRAGKRQIGSAVFPITSYTGSPVGIQTRSITQKAFDTFALQRRPEGYFFGISVAIESIWDTKEVWLVEGPADQLIMERLVAPNVLALTTNSVGKLQAKFLRRFVRRVNLCLDLDQAGREGVRSFRERFGNDFDIRDIKYPKINGSKDVGDVWKQLGDHRFRDYFAKSVLSTF